MDAIAHYWGKASPAGATAWHPLAYHSLDVAACALEILRVTPELNDKPLQGYPASRVAAISALHDLGKFGQGFQRLAEAVHGELQPDPPPGNFSYGGELHHSHTGFVLWRRLRKELGLPRQLDHLMSASCGHHGQPPRPNVAERDFVLCFAERDVVAARAFIEGVFEFLDLPGDGENRDFKRLSFVLSGIINMADWIGSNQEWFPYQRPEKDLQSYWQWAQERAHVAIKEAHLIPAQPSGATFAQMFPGYTPTPMQSACDSITICGQSLFVIEDTTGSGKTQAADALGARLMSFGYHRLIFALPTTATADGLAQRHAEYYRKFFNSDGATMHLAHSRTERPASNESLDEASVDIAAWLSGDPRLRLSANICVGTADQVCLAAMPARFNALRLFSLLGATLVFDEVHAYDTYTGTLLRAALKMHAALGGSAILMSATMPKEQRQQLVEAFCDGVGWSMSYAPEDGFPMITAIDQNGVRQLSLESTRKRTIPMRPIHSSDEAVSYLLSTVKNGCAVWMRTTVADAIDGYQLLRAQHENVLLLHARFPEGWRGEKQKEILERFGKNGNPASRKGWVVVATQIIQESLDLDFDAAVIDLRPIDALIQAMGRWRRHERDEAGRLVAQDSRRPDNIRILMPALEQDIDERWLRRILPKTEFVYRNLGLLWRTARLVDERREIRYPDDLRSVIDAIYGSDECPELLLRRQDAAEREVVRHETAAVNLSLSPDEGYLSTAAAYAADQTIATRLGNSREVCLLKEKGKGLEPLLGSIRRSCVRVPANTVEGATQDALSRAQSDPHLRYLIPVIVEDYETEKWSGMAMGPRGEVRVEVSEDLGVQVS